VKFEADFPWTSKTATALKKTFAQEKKIEIQWHWEPFHKPGLAAAQYASAKGFGDAQFKKTVSALSTPTAPSRLLRRLKKEGCLDKENTIKSLDPEKNILKTYSLAGEKIATFDDAILMKISDLKTLLGENISLWKPDLERNADFTLLSTWLTPKQQLLKRFHSLKDWDKLLVIENLVGLTNPSSNLHFTRIQN
jgi:hypothetical protein